MCILLIPSGLSVSDHETAMRERGMVALHLFLADEMNRCIIVGEVVRHRYDLFFDTRKISTLFSNNIALSCVFLSRCELRSLAISDSLQHALNRDCILSCVLHAINAADRVRMSLAYAFAPECIVFTIRENCVCVYTI